jgi:hypothetical protein
MKDQERVRDLMSRLRRLRSQEVSESERSIFEVAARALENELTVLGRRLRNGQYWSETFGPDDGEVSAA